MGRFGNLNNQHGRCFPVVAIVGWVMNQSNRLPFMLIYGEVHCQNDDVFAIFMIFLSIRSKSLIHAYLIQKAQKI